MQIFFAAESTFLTLTSPMMNTSNIFPIKLSAIALSVAALASCGGGGSSSDSAAAGSSTQIAAATLADCLKLTPGVKFLKTNGYTDLVVQEQFEGQSQLGITELRGDGTRFGTNYYSIGDTYFQVLGSLNYAMNGIDLDSKTVYSGNKIPVNMVAGQTVTFTYTENYNRYGSPSYSSTSSTTEQVTFVGFEDITLGGRVFKNACKIKEPVLSSTAGETYMTWLARDYGAIKFEKQDAQGNTIDGTRVELKTIITAPAS